MAEPIQTFYLLLIFFGMVYFVIILIYTVGWFKLKTFHPRYENSNTLVSIIVPARNEAGNIKFLLHALYEQNYPKKNFEVIIVDDNSTDETVEIVSTFIEEHVDFQIKIIQLKAKDQEASYKKKAITRAIESSNGELIITTDADCYVNKDWLQSFVSIYQSEKPQMIVGPVCFHKGNSFFEKMQTFEFLSLIAITAGAIRIRRPIMCNGANLAYEKTAFIAVGGFGKDKFSSGDDVFLLLKIKKHFGNQSVRFVKTQDALVYTEPKKSIKDFIHQRVRWASKNKGYDARILLVSFTVYMVNLLLIAGLLMTMVYPSIIKIVIVAMLIKMLVELPILFGITKFVNQKKIMFYVFPMIILYPLYIIITGALGIIGNYQWKGRKIRN